LLENRFQHLDVDRRDTVIQVEEIHQYNHDSLCNQSMAGWESLAQDKVHHRTRNIKKKQ